MRCRPNAFFALIFWSRYVHKEHTCNWSPLCAEGRKVFRRKYVWFHPVTEMGRGERSPVKTVENISRPFSRNRFGEMRFDDEKPDTATIGHWVSRRSITCIRSTVSDCIVIDNKLDQGGGGVRACVCVCVCARACVCVCLCVSKCVRACEWVCARRVSACVSWSVLYMHIYSYSGVSAGGFVIPGSLCLQRVSNHKRSGHVKTLTFSDDNLMQFA